MILGRGALSWWTRIRSSHQGCQLPCESCEDNISAGESQCRLQAGRSSIPRYLGVVRQSLHILHMSCSCGSLLYFNNMYLLVHLGVFCHFLPKVSELVILDTLKGEELFVNLCKTGVQHLCAARLSNAPLARQQLSQNPQRVKR